MDDQERPDGNERPKRRRGPKRITKTYLENSAAHYLGRFATSSAHLRQVMMQKVERSSRHHGTDPEEGRRFVDEIIGKFERLGYLDDAAFATMRARSLHARGTPVRGIRFTLQQKGVPDEAIDDALSQLEEEERVGDLDLAAAVRMARRRRLGPYRTEDAEERRARRDKDLATLARQGFSYDVARRVIEAGTVEELEDEAGQP